MLVSFRSNNFPVNTIPGEFGIPIFEIRLPTAQELIDYPTLIASDVIVSYTGAPGVITPGWMITIANTTLGVYNGNYRVTKVPVDGLAVIDASYTQDDDGGELALYYERYTVIAEVKFSGLADPVTIDVKCGEDGLFTFDLRDIAQRGFRDILSDVEMRPGLPYDDIVPGADLITQVYNLNVWHGYMLPTGGGVSTFVEIKKLVEVKVQKRYCVNAVQPYHHTDINGNVDLSWQEDLVDYLVDPIGRAAGRFLTYAPREGQVVREDDDVFLAFLWAPANTTYPMRIAIDTYDEAGTLLASTRTVVGVKQYSNVMRVGPANLGAIITADTHHYKVWLNNDVNPDAPVTEIFTFTLDRSCGEKYLRLTALNPLGGVDAFTSEVRELNGVEVERSTTSKPDMAVDYATDWVGDYNSRTWAISMARTFDASTKPVSAIMRKWFGENIFTSPDVRVQIMPGRWTPVILTTRVLPMYTSEQRSAPLRFSFVLGVDNIRQRR